MTCYDYKVYLWYTCIVMWFVVSCKWHVGEGENTAKSAKEFALNGVCRVCVCVHATILLRTHALYIRTYHCTDARNTVHAYEYALLPVHTACFTLYSMACIPTVQ